MSVLRAMPAVGLDELVDRAALLTRVDRKYVLPRARVEPVLQALAPHARVSMSAALVTSATPPPTTTTPD